MSYLIKTEVINAIKEDMETLLMCYQDCENSRDIVRLCYKGIKREIDRLPQYRLENVIETDGSSQDIIVERELKILRNYISNMPKVYRKRNSNWVIVQDLIMNGTNKAGMTSSIAECWRLGIDPYGYEL